MPKPSKNKPQKGLQKQQTWFFNWIYNLPEKVSVTMTQPQQMEVLRRHICDVDKDIHKLINDRQRSIDKLLQVASQTYDKHHKQTSKDKGEEWEGKLLVHNFRELGLNDEGLMVKLARCSLPNQYYELKHKEPTSHQKVFVQESTAADPQDSFGLKPNAPEQALFEVHNYNLNGTIPPRYLEHYSEDFKIALDKLSRL